MVAETKKYIDALLQERERVIVAIEGSCAGGKTTLAEALGREYGCNVLPMDDFFLRPEQRTEERFAQPGGNVDYERFFEEVLQPLLRGEPFSYRPFDCSTGALAEPVAVVPGRLTLVEGSYCLHPHFGDVYDLKIFLTVNDATRRRRILGRPAFLHRRFFEQWIPMEQRYFEAFDIRSKCDLILDTSEDFRPELEAILRTHGEKYPKMEPADAVKLIYQNEFGGGHLIRDEEACLNYLRREYEAVPRRAEGEWTEDIGNGICRVMLSALDAKGMQPDTLGRIFIRSAREHRGDLNSFLQKLDLLRTLTAEGIFGFTAEELETYLQDYAQAGYPAVSHSRTYRENYHPAYRIVLKDLLD